MAFTFVCDLNEPLEITDLSGNGEHIARVAIGYDEDRTYSAVVALSPRPGYGDQADFELVFSVVETNEPDDHIHDYWDGLETKAILANPNQRATVLKAIETMVEHLIDVASPSVVSVVTHTPNLPTSALRKFHQIAAVFAHKGYEVGEADPWNGQRIWMMKRGT